MNKQLLNKKSSARRLLAVWLTICMLGSFAVTSQAQMSHRGCGDPGKTIKPTRNELRSGLKAASTGTVKLNGGSNAISWDDAMAALVEGTNTIELQSDVTFSTVPTKACTITGAGKTLTYSGWLFMQAPLTFENIKLSTFHWVAQGHALIIGTGVTIVGSQDGVIYGGGSTANYAETNVVVKSGTFSQLFGGCYDTGNVGTTHVTIEGGYFSSVVYGGCPQDAGQCAKTNVTIKGGTIEGTTFGGSNNTTCGSTDVQIEGGSLSYIYGGGWEGTVTNISKLTIKGGTISGTAFGGGNKGTCGSTDVNVSGGNWDFLFGGGYAGEVTGLANLVVTGGTLVGDYGEIYGGGCGVDSYQEPDNPKVTKTVGSVRMSVSNMTAPAKKDKYVVSAGGKFTDVKGDAELTIDGGVYSDVFGSYYKGAYNDGWDPKYQFIDAYIHGNVNIRVKDADIDNLRALYLLDDMADNDFTNIPDFAPLGKTTLTIEGRTIINKLITSGYIKGDAYDVCKVVIKNQGSDATPYVIPCLQTISELMLDNSVVTLKPAITKALRFTDGIIIKNGHPLKITGTGKLIGTDIPVREFNNEVPDQYTPLILMDNPQENNSFVFTKKDGTALETFRAGKAFRLNGDAETLYPVTITTPKSGEGTLLVKWEDATLDDGDEMPAEKILKVTAIPGNNYVLASITATSESGQKIMLKNGETYTMTKEGVTFAATFTYVPPYIPTYYTVTIPEVKGVTTTPQPGNYVAEEGYNFSFTLRLDGGYENSKPIVKANGVIVEPRASDNKYIIRNITEDMKITIEGIENPTANAEVEGTVKVQAIGSTLHIYLPKEETISIYTLSGLLYKELPASVGNMQIQLTKGIYIVKIGEVTDKVIIR